MPEGSAPAGGSASLPADELLGLALQSEVAGDLDRAERLLGHLLASQPNHPEAHHLLAVVAYRRGQFERALDHAQASFRHGHDTPRYWRNIAEYYRCLGRYDEALVAGHKAVALNPSDPAVLHNCGLIEAEHLHMDAAIRCFEQALALDPTNAGAHFGLAESLLMRGDLARGWAEYEWRFRIPDATPPMPPTDRPHWDGAPFSDGTLLLVADQGFGDGVQFGRFIPWAAARCPDLAVATGPELLPLLRQVHPAARFFTRWEERGAFKAWSTLTGLPRLHGTTLDTVPAPIPYLQADPARVARWRARLDRLAPRGLQRIGIVWAGRPTHKNDAKRSIALDDLAPLAARDDVALVVLQKGPAQRQVGRYYGRAPLIHLSAEIADFSDTMALMAGLDLVLSVDTSVAHLAGAMGLPVWILLPWSAEWRWLMHRANTPWYPTARLFRQPARGDWAGAVRDVVAAWDARGRASADAPG